MPKYQTSKRYHCLEVHGLMRSRMHKPQLLGMEIQTVCRLTVESVAKDGTAKAVAMGAVDSQLVSPAGMGI